MVLKRSAGILLHPTSLSGPEGIGTLGEQARAFVDRLAEAGQTWWQVLPLNAPGHGGSPYSATSAFAGNAMMIDLEPLRDAGWLTRPELDDLAQAMDRLPDDRVDYGELYEHKGKLLEAACERWSEDDRSEGNKHTREEFDAFLARESEWLDDYTLFMVLKRHFGGGEWREWPIEYVERRPDALKEARVEHAEALRKIEFNQWLFFRQWHALRDYAAERGVKFIGDIPIFVAMDSADVWANREIFQMDEDGNVEEVSGVPPDYFSKTGQKWGNPLYDWEAIEEQDFKWWLDRVEKVLDTVDLVRIDHFRGFQAYWAVPADAPTAESGEWRDGPQDALFEAIREDIGEVPFIAEDLGMITDDVLELRDRHNLPGMKVMQFADWDDPDHIFLPENYEENFVAYTGTHDNDTTRGWYDSLDEGQRHKVRQYLQCSDDEVVWKMIEAVFDSEAALAIVPVQDIFELGTEARMNNPGANGDNWLWRMPKGLIERGDAWERLGGVTGGSGRSS